MIGDLSISDSFDGSSRFQARTTVSAGRHYFALLILAMLACCFWLPLVSRAQTTAMAALTSPAPSSVLTGSSATFKWSAGTGVSAYILYLGTLGPGTTNIYTSPAATATSVTVTGIPTNGVNLYATVFSKINGSWEPNYFTYTEAGTPAPAVLTSPAPGTILSGSSVTFTWSTGSGPTAYLLYLGTTAEGSSNLYASPSTTTATSVTVTGIPTSGATVYATLYSKINGVWKNVKYTYTEAAPATLISPTPGTVLSGSSVTFTWKGSSPSTAYLLYLGTIVQGSANIYDSGTTTATSLTVNNLPTAGVLIYVTVLTKLNGAWEPVYYTFTEAGTPVLAALTSPAPGGVLGSSATFTWSPGAGPTAYLLYLGTSAGSTNIYSSPAATTATSATVSGIPTSGATVYATLYSKIDGVWQNVKYTYTETTPVPKLTVSSSSLGFGSVTIGSPATQTVTLTSSGTAALTISSASATGTGFSMTGPALPVTLNPGQTAALDVEFNPTATGTDSGLLTISSNSSTGATTVVSLSGTALAAAYQVNLAWNAPQNPPVAIAGYNVYRATGSSTTYQMVNPSLDSATSFSDTSVQAGMAYTYYVESVDSSGVSSAPSTSYAVTIP
jgi:hypothetical protein